VIQTKTGPKVLTWADVQAKKKRREVTHPVVTDDDARVVYQLAEERLRKAKVRGNATEIAEAQAAADTAEQALRDATLLFRLRALPRKGDRSWQALVAEHPPTEGQVADWREKTGNPKAGLRWNSDTFGPALVAACLTEPQVTPEQAAEMSDEWNEAEWDGLLGAAIGVNENATDTAGLVFS
jgi:hypothetical protein